MASSAEDISRSAVASRYQAQRTNANTSGMEASVAPFLLLDFPMELVESVLYFFDARSLAISVAASKVFARVALKACKWIKEQERDRILKAMVEPIYKGFTLDEALRAYVQRGGLPSPGTKFERFSLMLARKYEWDNGLIHPNARYFARCLEAMM